MYYNWKPETRRFGNTSMPEKPGSMRSDMTVKFRTRKLGGMMRKLSIREHSSITRKPGIRGLGSMTREPGTSRLCSMTR